MINLTESYDPYGTSSTMFKIYKEDKKYHTSYVFDNNCRTIMCKCKDLFIRGRMNLFVADDISHDLGEMIFLIFFVSIFSKSLTG